MFNHDKGQIVPENFFQTIFVNESHEYRKVHDGGHTLLELAPGATDEIMTDNPSKSYARFSKITFRADGSAKIDYNKAWKMPNLASDTFVCELFNDDGNDIEVIYVGGEPVQVYRQIPKLIFPKFDDRWALYSEAFFQKKPVERPSKENPYYVETTWPVKIYTVVRPKDELQKIKAIMQERQVRVPEELERELAR